MLGGKLLKEQQLKQIHTTVLKGKGGISSTAEDVVRFSQVFMGRGKEILSNKAVKAMEQEEYKKGMWPGDSDNVFNYGLGWDSVIPI